VPTPNSRFAATSQLITSLFDFDVDAVNSRRTAGIAGASILDRMWPERERREIIRDLAIAAAHEVDRESDKQCFEALYRQACGREPLAGAAQALDRARLLVSPLPASHDDIEAAIQGFRAAAAIHAAKETQANAWKQPLSMDYSDPASAEAAKLAAVAAHLSEVADRLDSKTAVSAEAESAASVDYWAIAIQIPEGPARGIVSDLAKMRLTESKGSTGFTAHKRTVRKYMKLLLVPLGVAIARQDGEFISYLRGPHAQGVSAIYET